MNQRRSSPNFVPMKTVSSSQSELIGLWNQVPSPALVVIKPGFMPPLDPNEPRSCQSKRFTIANFLPKGLSLFWTKPTKIGRMNRGIFPVLCLFFFAIWGCYSWQSVEGKIDWRNSPSLKRSAFWWSAAFDNNRELLHVCRVWGVFWCQWLWMPLVFFWNWVIVNYYYYDIPLSMMFLLLRFPSFIRIG